MAKTDNLKDFVKDISDALRIRYNNTNTYNPQNFYEKIIALSGITDSTSYDIKSLQQFISHVGNGIKKGKGFDLSTTLIDPQDYYDLIMTINLPFVSKSNAVAR